jgi:type IV pilus assembly protein PilW
MHTKTTFSVASYRLQTGLTLIELMVSMVLMLLVTVATVSLFNVTSQSSKTVDASAEMDDTARFAFNVISRAIQVAGYREFARFSNDTTSYAKDLYAGCINNIEPCPMQGFDNSIVTAAAFNYGSAGSGTVNNSDSLFIQFAGSGVPGGAADGSIENCLGIAVTTPVINESMDMTARRQALASSSFYVAYPNNDSNREPELYCRVPGDAQPIARGVESMQLLYAIDTNGDSVPERWVTAANIAVWTQVRAVRVGLVLRGRLGSAQVSSSASYYPLGDGFSADLPNADRLFVSPADTRLRRSYVATFFIRNEL